MKSILIFGAGLNQITLIKAAHELGLRSIVIDPDSLAPGRVFADIFEVVGPLDFNKTLRIAEKYKVSGIVTSQMENPLRLMAKLAQVLDFIFPSQEVIEKCRNKYLMKQAFIENKIPCADGSLYLKLNGNEAFGIEYPLIIKPTDSYSSRGVYVVNNINDLMNIYRKSAKFSSDGSFIIEEYLEGTEFSIEAITFQGETTIIQYTEKIVSQSPYSVEMGHIQPASLDASQKKKIDTIIIKAISVLGIKDAVTHSEIIVSDEGLIKVIEIGARLGGDYISSYLTLNSCGVNLDKAAIMISLGERPVFNPKYKAFCCIKYLELEIEKTVVKIGDWKEILEESDVIHADLNLKIGQTILPITDSAKRPGFIIVKGKSKKEVNNKSGLYIEKLANYVYLI